MGIICSCFCLDGLEEYIHSDASSHRCCSCFRFLAQQIIILYATLTQREVVQAIPLVEQGMESSASTVDTSISNFHSPPIPLPYDDPRFSHLRRKREESCHFLEESEALRGSNDDSNLEMSTTRKCSGSSFEEKSKLDCSKLMSNDTSGDVTSERTYVFPSYEIEEEYEDMCPTCLEEYTYENPRIIMKCSHHFHLSCIYEWKERSELCPVCGKVMVFDET